jgi:hypothetical protein
MYGWSTKSASLARHARSSWNRMRSFCLGLVTKRRVQDREGEVMFKPSQSTVSIPARLIAVVIVASFLVVSGGSLHSAYAQPLQAEGEFEITCRWIGKTRIDEPTCHFPEVPTGARVRRITLTAFRTIDLIDPRLTIVYHNREEQPVKTDVVSASRTVSLQFYGDHVARRWEL